MSNGTNIVVTAYGHDKVIDKISVSLFDKPEVSYYRSKHESNAAEEYCKAINSLELHENKWVSAQIISECAQYSLGTFRPFNFENIILRLDDRSIQKIMREVDSRELAKALKSEDTEVLDKVFRNMSKNAATMLKEDMEYIGPVRLRDVKESQEKILSIVNHLEDTGEITIIGENEELI